MKAVLWMVVVAVILGGAGSMSTPAEAVEACQSTITFGSGATFQEACISAKGNVIQFESPENVTHMAAAASGEGYAVCSKASATAVETKHGFDTGSVTGGFGPATISQPNGPNTLPLCIVRDTLDGVFRLRQCFSRDTVEHEVTITMTLTNLSSASRTAVALSRYFNGDVNGTAVDDRYSITKNSVLAWQDGVTRHGLMLIASQGGQVSQTAYVEQPNMWEPATLFKTSRGCRPPFTLVTPTNPGNFVGRLTFDLSTMAPGQSKVVTATYRRF